MTLLKLTLYYGAHAFWPFALACLWVALRGRGWLRYAAMGALLLSLPLAWARFAEPRLLTVHRETILLPGANSSSPAIRIALFGDPHIGIFKNAMPIERIVAQINAEGVDAVFLAGDLTYHPEPEDIPEDFAALATLDAPLFAVLGNHDVGFPGENLTEPLMRMFQETRARVAHNRAIDTEIAGHRIIVAGASDLWERQQDFGFSASLPDGVPVLLLTHNPDTALTVPEDFRYDLMLAGHTHGGQVRIPGLYQKVLPVTGPFDKELHRFQSPSGERLVYVTTGTGMVGVPLRFLMPPRIDVLTVHLPE
ncbi:metallophosphoesterase [Hyphomonas sp. WL0036]|uniref:metallophosphoesterase n=1 Tax=Hyphomonas sediminis TaxID=2866160 RepID=UPI001C81E65D|nr:metallophosphoesterase [Hyphomonas sediminis]MBY9067896.1 metallophosphoesterase [Hyphomonas sediminis]